MEASVKTRVLIISDTHCAPLSKRDGKGRSLSPPFKAPLPTADVLIHCGDLTYSGQIEEYNHALDMLKEIDAPVKLVIAGNHDLSLDHDYVFSHIDQKRPSRKSFGSREEADKTLRQATDLWLSPSGRAKKEGVTFLEEGVHQVDLPNGARIKVYASPYTAEFHDFGFAYARHEDRFNPPEASFSDARNIAKHPVLPFSDSDTIDFLITHGPPYGRLDQTARGDHAGCPHLLTAIMRSRPLVCCFGHIHEAWGGERIRWSEATEESDSNFTISAFLKQQGWRDGDDIRMIQADLDLAKREHAVFLDLSASMGSQVERGRETILLNASVMDLKYNPKQAPWLVDIDLPKAK